MKNSIENLLKHITRLLIICVILYIIMLISLFFNEKSLTLLYPITRYINSAWESIVGIWKWIVFVALIPIVCNTSYRVYSELAEGIRHNRFYAEIDRWLDTPYISPLHHLYMIKPPSWLRIEEFNPFRNELYKNATKVFSEIVYFQYAYSNFEPSQRSVSWLKVIPKKHMKTLIIEIFLILIMTVTYIKTQGFFSDYSLFLLIFVIKWTSRSYYRITAIWEHARWTTYEKSIKDHFGEIEPKTKWIELFPNTEQGQQILKVWKAESTLRQKRDETFRLSYKANVDRSYDLNKIPRVLGSYDMPNHAACPFPSEKVPDWVENYESYHQEQFDDKKAKDYETLRSIIKESQGQVVDFLAAKNKKKK